MDPAVFILDRLLASYERTRHFKGEAKVNRKVRLRFTPENVPDYFDETNPAQKALFNEIAKELAGEGLIAVNWIPFEVDNLIDELNLVLEKIEDAYVRCGRPRKREMLTAVQDCLSVELAKAGSPWILAFFEDCLQHITTAHEVPGLLPEDAEERELLLSALHGLELIAGEEMLERVFSRRFLGNSKALARIRPRLSGIIRRYAMAEKEGCSWPQDNESILAAVGLAGSLEELLFQGPLQVELKGKTIDFTPLCYGAAMNTDTIKAFRVLALPIERLITFENKTNYLDFVKKDKDARTMGVYLGGFHSPIKQLFLQKLVDFLKNCDVQYLHWGDIDLGGFRIFVHLRAEALPDLRPYRMDSGTLLRCIDYADGFEDAYERELRKLLIRPEYDVFHDVIRVMVVLRRRLEQEAILIDD